MSSVGHYAGHFLARNHVNRVVVSNTSTLKGNSVMTKAKARARAKARAVAKAAKPDAKGEKVEVKVRTGHFDAKSNAMRNTAGGANVHSNVGMRRGAARSR